VVPPYTCKDCAYASFFPHLSFFPISSITKHSGIGMRCKSAPDSKNQEVRIPIQSAHTNHRHRGRGSQEPATRSSSPQNTVTNQETEKGAEAGGATSTGDERRQWRRMSRGSAGEESERGSHRAGPPKMKATRRGGRLWR
jgi:hypothetical protein